MIAHVIAEMVGSDKVPDRQIPGERLGGDGKFSTRAKWRALFAWTVHYAQKAFDADIVREAIYRQLPGLSQVTV